MSERIESKDGAAPELGDDEFNEVSSDLYLSALIEIGLVLFVITLVINALSRLLIWSVTREVKAKAPREAPTAVAAKPQAAA